MMRTRFAPSPTGPIHLGHVYAAMYAYNLASKNAGECLLRFEDIDTTRVRKRFYSQIVEDLAFLGLNFPEPMLMQTKQNSRYTEVLHYLIEQKFVYPCFCSRKQIQQELSQVNRAPHGPEGIHYPKTCLALTDYERQKKIDSGLQASWRLNSFYASQTLKSLTFKDQKFGEVRVDSTLLGDLILARKDIGTSYHLAVVHDDEEQAISDVTRGEDLLHATHIHRVLQTILGYSEPFYHHHLLIVDDKGNRLSKRQNSLSVQDLRRQGASAEEILAKIPVP